jgi:hypothetical protein
MDKRYIDDYKPLGSRCSVCNAELIVEARYFNSVSREKNGMIRMDHHTIWVCPKRLRVLSIFYSNHDRVILTDDGSQVTELETQIRVNL